MSKKVLAKFQVYLDKLSLPHISSDENESYRLRSGILPLDLKMDSLVEIRFPGVLVDCDK